MDSFSGSKLQKVAEEDVGSTIYWVYDPNVNRWVSLQNVSSKPVTKVHFNSNIPIETKHNTEEFERLKRLDFDHQDVELVMESAEVSEYEAMLALEKFGNAIDATMYLMDTDFGEQVKQLEDSKLKHKI